MSSGDLEQAGATLMLDADTEPGLQGRRATSGREQQQGLDLRLQADGVAVLGNLPHACTGAFPVSLEPFAAAPSHLAHLFHLPSSKWARKQEKQTSR